MRTIKPGQNPSKSRKTKSGGSSSRRATASKSPLLPSYTKYLPEYSHVALEACSNLGADIADLAKMFRVSLPTVYNWMNRYPEFHDAVKRGRDRYDSEKVESSLLRRAVGYDIEIREERLTREGEVVPLRRTMHVPADVGAAEFWLVNRNRSRWQSIASKYQQLNLFPPTSQPSPDNGKGNGKEHKDAERYAAETLREVALTLNAAGAFDVISETGDHKGSDAKVN